MEISNIKKSKILSFLVVTGMIALLICISPTEALAGQAEDLFAFGNQAYAGGKYDEALSHYKRVIEQKGYSASLLYNMANSYYKQKNVGQAILHYERALYLDPGNADIRANLALARKDFGLIPDPAPKWLRFFDLLNLNGWAILASGAFGVFALLFLLSGIRPATFRGAALRTITVASLLILVAGGVGATLQYRNLARGVVTRDHVRLLVSPFDAAASSSSIKDGKIVRMAKTYGGYILVKGENGQSGWVKRNAIEPVVPSGEYS